MEEKVRKKNQLRVRKVPETNLSNGKIIAALNLQKISKKKNSAAFLRWTKAEPEEINRRTKKAMAMHKVLHPKGDVENLYLLRKNDSRVY